VTGTRPGSLITAGRANVESLQVELSRLMESLMAAREETNFHCFKLMEYHTATLEGKLDLPIWADLSLVWRPADISYTLLPTGPEVPDYRLYATSRQLELSRALGRRIP
jgi:hypothetical protein